MHIINFFCSIGMNTVSQIILTFCFVLTYDPVEDRHIDEAINIVFCF